jgi:hypothetical protein
LCCRRDCAHEPQSDVAPCSAQAHEARLLHQEAPAKALFWGIRSGWRDAVEEKKVLLIEDYERNMKME